MLGAPGVTMEVPPQIFSDPTQDSDLGGGISYYGWTRPIEPSGSHNRFYSCAAWVYISPEYPCYH